MSKKKTDTTMQEEYMLGALVPAYILLSGKNKGSLSHINKRRVKERIERVIAHYHLEDSDIGWFCMRTTADYDHRPAGPGN